MRTNHAERPWGNRPSICSTLKTSPNSRRHSTPHRRVCGWCCCFHPPDRYACRGPLQPNHSWKETTTSTCACWWFGSRFCQPTGNGRRRQCCLVFAKPARCSSGTSTTWWPIKSPASSTRTLPGPNPTVARGVEIFGTLPRFTPRAPCGRRPRRKLSSPTAPSHTSSRASRASSLCF